MTNVKAPRVADWLTPGQPIPLSTLHGDQRADVPEAATTAVLRVLRLASGPLAPTEITSAAGLRTRSLTRTALRDLQDAGLVHRPEPGRYALAPKD